MHLNFFCKLISIKHHLILFPNQNYKETDGGKQLLGQSSFTFPPTKNK